MRVSWEYGDDRIYAENGQKNKGLSLAKERFIRFDGGRRSPLEKYQWFWFYSSMH